MLLDFRFRGNDEMTLIRHIAVTPAKAGVQLLIFSESAMTKGGFVYIMANRYRGTLYIGVTANIGARTFQHREGIGAAFTKRYGATRLVYVEQVPTIEEAIAREKAMKKWRREWKITLIEKHNPEWRDLFEDINA